LCQAAEEPREAAGCGCGSGSLNLSEAQLTQFCPLPCPQPNLSVLPDNDLNILLLSCQSLLLFISFYTWYFNSLNALK